MKRTNPDNPTKKERRKYSRKALFTDVNYKVISSLGERGKTQNISEGGLCMMLKRELSPGTMLEMKFELPSEESKPVEALAKVVWQKRTDRGFLTGLNFQK